MRINYSLSELPDCQLKLAQRSDVTEQAMKIAVSPHFTAKTAIVSTSYLLCLAQSRDTHKYLLQPILVSKLIEMCNIRKADGNPEAVMALE